MAETVPATDTVRGAQLPLGPVVVGVDGSDCSMEAVTLGAQEAGRHHMPLRLVHAFVWPYLPSVPMAAPPVAPAVEEMHDAAEAFMADAERRARAVDPALDVSTHVTDGTASAVLIEESQRAGMIVLGDRGLGGFSGMLLGSVAVQVVTHAAGPVLVARGRSAPRGPVLLAVDGSPRSEPAIGFAFAEASLRGTELVALHAWTHPVRGGPGEMVPLVYDADDIRNEEERLLAEAVAGWCERYPEVPVRRKLVRGRPVPALLAAAETAQLVVVGARGRGGFTGLLLGSVSQGVLHHAECPVAIVRRRHDG